MDSRIERAATVGRAVVHEVRAERITFLAGSIAYHAFVSMLPLFLLLLTVVTQFRDAGLRESVVALIRAVLTPGVADQVVRSVQGSGTGVSLLGFGFLLWGTLRIFRGLDTAFSDIYESERENTFLDQVGDGLLVLATFALAILAAVLVTEVVPLDGDGLLAALARGAFLVAALAVVFYPMYYVFPDCDVSPVEVLPGVLLAAVGLTASQSLFQVYVDVTGRNPEGTNVVASILLLLTWLYVSGLVVLLGATVNAVLSNRSRDVDIAPVVGSYDVREPRTDADAADLSRDLERLERLLADAESVTVEVDGERVELAPPGEVTTETEQSKLRFDTSVGTEWRWWPR